jgi:hypothetical protein
VLAIGAFPHPSPARTCKRPRSRAGAQSTPRKCSRLGQDGPPRCRRSSGVLRGPGRCLGAESGRNQEPHRGRGARSVVRGARRELMCARALAACQLGATSAVQNPAPGAVCVVWRPASRACASFHAPARAYQAHSARCWCRRQKGARKGH